MNNHTFNLTQDDYIHLQHCIKLAEEAVTAGDEPFGSVLVDKRGKVLAAERNRVNERNILAHPEIGLADWALDHLTAEERKSTTMYTSGEHCPMCACAHGWAGLGKVVYICSAKQLSAWLEELGVAPSPIRFIPIQEIIISSQVIGPIDEMADKIKALHFTYQSTKPNS